SDEHGETRQRVTPISPVGAKGLHSSPRNRSGSQFQRLVQTSRVRSDYTSAKQHLRHERAKQASTERPKQSAMTTAWHKQRCKILTGRFGALRLSDHLRGG